jgi:16S rRNA (guanine527-N7)-methyltransferase
MVDPLSYSIRDLENDVNVSRETSELLEAYVVGLIKWQKTINLIGPETIPVIWHRHILDSAQLIQHIPEDMTSLMDMGSGAGLPGLVLAILLKERAPLSLHLVESDKRKSAFLIQMAAELGLNLTIEVKRIENLEPRTFDVITARALAPVKDLLDYAQPFCNRRTVCLFLKGQNVVSELTEATKYWNMQATQFQSMTDQAAHIVAIKDFHRV